MLTDYKPRRANIFSILLILFSFIFLISLKTDKIIFFVLMILFILLLMFTPLVNKSIANKLQIFFTTYMVYLIFYFFIQSYSFNAIDFELKQKLVILFKLSIFYICSFLLLLPLKIYKRYFLFYGYFALLCFLMSINNLSIMEKSIYLLNSFFPILILFFILDKIKTFSFSIKIFDLFIYFYFFSLAVSTFLLFDLLSWDKDFFEKIYENSLFALVNNLPRTWFTAFLDFDLFRRFNGTLADPIIFGYISAVVLLIVSYSRNSKLLFFPIVLLFLLFSLSKGSYALYVFVMLLNLIGVRFFYKNITLWLIFVIAAVVMLAIGSIGRGSSADIHFLGLVLPFLNIFEYSIIEILFGHGFTSGGNLAKSIGIVDELSWLKTGAESGIGTIFYQTGLIGLGFVILIFYKQIQNSKLYTKNFITIYFILMFTQENLINMNYLMLLFIGILFFQNLEREANAK